MKAQEQVEKLKTFQESMHEIANKVLSLGDGSVMLNDVAEGKKQIAEAINTKGGEASADSSFAKLAEDIQTLPYAGISAEGIVQTEEFSFLDSFLNSSFSAIREIYDDKATNIPSLKSLVSLEKATFLNAVSGTGNMANELRFLKILIMPKLENIARYMFPNVLQILVVGTLKTANDTYVNDYPFLRMVVIGQNTDCNIVFLHIWTATNVIAEGQSGIDELNENLYNNLLTKLADHSSDGQTRTLRIGWLAHVTQENIDYANSKGWTLTT